MIYIVRIYVENWSNTRTTNQKFRPFFLIFEQTSTAIRCPRFLNRDLSTAGTPSSTITSTASSSVAYVVFRTSCDCFSHGQTPRTCEASPTGTVNLQQKQNTRYNIVNIVAYKTLPLLCCWIIRTVHLTRIQMVCYIVCKVKHQDNLV